MTDRRDFTRIRGLSEVRRLPRLGKIRLGVKVVSQRTGNEYPKEVAWFVCPPEVQRVYGEQPTKLDIMIPVEDETRCFPQAYKAYVRQGLRCKGDGERALRRRADLVWQADGKVLDDATQRVARDEGGDENSLVEIGCPCTLLDGGQCRQSGNLMVLLPRVSMGGIYQLDSGSIHNIIRINSAIDYVRALLGRVALVPLILSRQQEEIEYEGKKAKHYLLQCTLNANLEEVVKLRENARMILTQVERIALPAPVEDGPEPTGGGVVLEEEAEEPTVPVAQPGQVTEAPVAEVASTSQGDATAEDESRQATLSPPEQEWARVRELSEVIGWDKNRVAAYCKEHYGPPKKMTLLKVQALVRHLQSLTEKG